MKRQAVRLATEFNLALFAAYEKGRALGRRALAMAGKQRIVDLTSVVDAGRAGLTRRAKRYKKAPAIMSRLLRSHRVDRRKPIAVPPTNEAFRSKTVEASDTMLWFVPDVRETTPETRAVAKELREARVSERRSLKLSEPVRASLERARRRRSRIKRA